MRKCVNFLKNPFPVQEMTISSKGNGFTMTISSKGNGFTMTISSKGNDHFPYGKWIYIEFCLSMPVAACMLINYGKNAFKLHILITN